MPINIGLRGGLGMDISGGLAFGAAGNYQIDLDGSVAELGINLFGGGYKDEETSGLHTYTETTSLLLFGVMANYLFNYQPGVGGPFFVAGAGLAAVSVSWTEESATDTSLGTPLPGGGSKQTVDAFAGGSALNLGGGYLFENGVDVRFEIPTILIFGGPGRSASVVPTFTITGGYRF